KQSRPLSEQPRRDIVGLQQAAALVYHQGTETELRIQAGQGRDVRSQLEAARVRRLRDGDVGADVRVERAGEVLLERRPSIRMPDGIVDFGDSGVEGVRHGRPILSRSGVQKCNGTRLVKSKGTRQKAKVWWVGCTHGHHLSSLLNLRHFVSFHLLV